jgi:hypothetical protein
MSKTAKGDAGRKPGALPIENEITDLWSKLSPVQGYTSGWVAKLTQLFIATPANVQQALEEIAALEPDASKIPQPELRETATKLLALFRTQLEYPQPGMGVQDCGDGAFYIGLKNQFTAAFVPAFLKSANEKILYEAERLKSQPLNIVQKKQCSNAADYCVQTMKILAKQNPKVKDKVAGVVASAKAFKAQFMVPGLDADTTANDFSTMFYTMRENSDAPTLTQGYAQMLRALYDFTQSSSDLDVTAMTWLAQDMPIVRELSSELAVQLKMSPDSTVNDVWNAVSTKYAIPNNSFMKVMGNASDVCNAYAKEYLLDISADDHVVMQETPAYMAPMITGGQDIAVDYLTTKPVAYLYLTPAKNSSFLTMINIMVHEYSHGFNFVLAAKNAGSPLLNLMSPMQVPLTEGQAFWREWEYWAAAANCIGQNNLDKVQSDYVALYGKTPLEQSQAIRAAQLETYIWRVVRYIRALCDVQVNMGWRTFVDFLDWASEQTGLSLEFLYGECFTFLAQPGYPPAYAIDGITYGSMQQADIGRGETQKEYDTFASAMGFYPWTLCAKKLEQLKPKAVGGKHVKS